MFHSVHWYSLLYLKLVIKFYKVSQCSVAKCPSAFQEGWLNISVTAENLNQTTEPYMMTFEMIGQVRGLIVDDGNVITSKGQNKWFELTFESIGAGTCIMMDFADGIVQTFGEEWFCLEWQPDIEFVPGVPLTEPVSIEHVY